MYNTFQLAFGIALGYVLAKILEGVVSITIFKIISMVN